MLQYLDNTIQSPLHNLTSIIDGLANLTLLFVIFAKMSIIE